MYKCLHKLMIQVHPLIIAKSLKCHSCTHTHRLLSQSNISAHFRCPCFEHVCRGVCLFVAILLGLHPPFSRTRTHPSYPLSQLISNRDFPFPATCSTDNDAYFRSSSGLLASTAALALNNASLSSVSVEVTIKILFKPGIWYSLATCY